jgi:hypothetical protein
MESTILLPCSQEQATGRTISHLNPVQASTYTPIYWTSISILSYHICISLQSGIIPSASATKICTQRHHTPRPSYPRWFDIPKHLVYKYQPRAWGIVHAGASCWQNTKLLIMQFSPSSYLFFTLKSILFAHFFWNTLNLTFRLGRQTEIHTHRNV